MGRAALSGFAGRTSLVAVRSLQLRRVARALGAVVWRGSPADGCWSGTVWCGTVLLLKASHYPITRHHTVVFNDPPPSPMRQKDSQTSRWDWRNDRQRDRLRSAFLLVSLLLLGRAIVPQ